MLLNVNRNRKFCYHCFYFFVGYMVLFISLVNILMWTETEARQIGCSRGCTLMWPTGSCSQGVWWRARYDRPEQKESVRYCLLWGELESTSRLHTNNSYLCSCFRESARHRSLDKMQPPCISYNYYSRSAHWTK